MNDSEHIRKGRETKNRVKGKGTKVRRQMTMSLKRVVEEISMSMMSVVRLKRGQSVTGRRRLEISACVCVPLSSIMERTVAVVFVALDHCMRMWQPCLFVKRHWPPSGSWVGSAHDACDHIGGLYQQVRRALPTGSSQIPAYSAQRRPGLSWSMARFQSGFAAGVAKRPAPYRGQNRHFREIRISGCENYYFRHFRNSRKIHF